MSDFMEIKLAAERAERELAARRELFAVLAHEFRSPIGAILGFEELLSEGILGDVSDAGRDALARVRGSARQLLDLVAGLNDLSGNPGEEGTPPHPRSDGLELLSDALEAVRQDAAGRDTRIQFSAPTDLPAIDIDPERARRALRLALMAGVKSTAGGSIVLRASVADRALQIELEGTGLDPRRDEPDLSLKDAQRPRLTGAGLRIAMARQALAPAHGEITLLATPAGVTLRIMLPALARD